MTQVYGTGITAREVITWWCWSWNDRKVEARLDGFSVFFKLDRFIIIVTIGMEKGSVVDAGSGNWIIEDAEDGISVVYGGCSELVWKLWPMCSADGACNASVPDVGCNAHEVKSMHALSCENSLVASDISASIITTEMLQAYCACSLQLV